jgi:putative oxidoreductase
MKQTCASWCRSQNWASIGLLVLRLGIGFIFLWHGYGKIFGQPGMTAFSGMVGDMLGFPLPTVFAWLAALTEFLGGMALILGLGVRFVAWPMAFVMIVALAGVKRFGMPASDPDIALLFASVALGLMGAGRYSIDAHLCGCCPCCKGKKEETCCQGKTECCEEKKGEKGECCKGH